MPEELTPLFAGASGEYYQGEIRQGDIGKEHHCALCHITLKATEWQTHLQSNKHQARVTDTRDLLRAHFSVRDQMRTQWCARILAMPHTPWQDLVFAKFGRVLVHDEANVLAKVPPLLQELELKECISLLELAVWKAICCSNCPPEVTGYYGFQKWLAEGWKTTKPQYRRCNEVVAIMSSVVPFVKETEASTNVGELDNTPTETSTRTTDAETSTSSVTPTAPARAAVDPNFPSLV